LCPPKALRRVTPPLITAAPIFAKRDKRLTIAAALPGAGLTLAVVLGLFSVRISFFGRISCLLVRVRFCREGVSFANRLCLHVLSMRAESGTRASQSSILVGNFGRVLHVRRAYQALKNQPSQCQDSVTELLLARQGFRSAPAGRSTQARAEVTYAAMKAGRQIAKDFPNLKWNDVAGRKMP
jgi:hypothetical protein